MPDTTGRGPEGLHDFPKLLICYFATSYFGPQNSASITL